MMAKAIVGFRQLLEACRNSKFVGLDVRDNVIGAFRLTPIGRMLRNNLREEFNRGESGTTVYEGNSGVPLRENLAFVRDTFSTNLPFGLAEQERFSDRTVKLNDNYHLELDEGSFQTCSYLINPAVATEFLYKAQRQRKIWWMRFACDPGRYFISDLRQDPDTKVQSATIKARFGEEELTLEQLEMIPSAAARAELGDFQAKTGKSSRKITPNLLRIRQCAELATLQVILDAFESSSATSVRIHPKLAPYKCGIVAHHSEDPSQQEELQSLAKHLANVLRKANLTVLDCTQNGSSPSSKHHFRHLDSIGVPYGLVLRDQTLQNGLLQLRSRDTTVSETVHVSDLPHYLLRIITS